MKAVIIGAKISLGGTKQTQNNFDTFNYGNLFEVYGLKQTPRGGSRGQWC